MNRKRSGVLVSLFVVLSIYLSGIDNLSPGLNQSPLSILESPPVYKVYLSLILNQESPCETDPRVAEFVRLMRDGEQGRPQMNCHEGLLRGANAKARDLAEQGYFGHRTPAGVWPNAAAESVGCNIPWHWDRNANYIESLVAGTPNAKAAYEALIQSDAHEPHIRGRPPFSEQTNFAIGYYELAGSPYTFYWVIWTAVCNNQINTMRAANIPENETRLLIVR